MPLWPSAQIIYSYNTLTSAANKPCSIPYFAFVTSRLNIHRFASAVAVKYLNVSLQGCAGPHGPSWLPGSRRCWLGAPRGSSSTPPARYGLVMTLTLTLSNSVPQKSPFLTVLSRLAEVVW